MKATLQNNKETSEKKVEMCLGLCFLFLFINKRLVMICLVGYCQVAVSNLAYLMKQLKSKKVKAFFYPRSTISENH